jgi:flavin-dependent dehydrogenase
MTTPSDTYDTIVAGAGPAGVMAALHASARGRVLLVDSVSLPRDKSCGGMLHQLSQDFLEEWGGVPRSIVVDPEYINFRYVDWDRGIVKPTALRFANVDRAAFDDWLVSLLPANVDVIGRLAVTGFDQDADGVDVHLKGEDATHTVRCANLVGADGARSAVRRALGVGESQAYVTLQDFVEVDGELPHFFDCIYMREIGDSFAYAYVVPKGDRAIVGSVFYPKTKRPWEKQDHVLDILRAKMPRLGESRKREACAALYVRSADDVSCGVGRVLLAGEAAAFMSPTSGEGISYALRTGKLAGAAIAASQPLEALAAYAAAAAPISADIRRRLRWLPFMESRAGKYMAGFVPASLVSKVTQGL